MISDLRLLRDIKKRRDQELHALDIEYRKRKESLEKDFRARWFIYRALIPVAAVSGIPAEGILSTSIRRDIFEARSLVIWMAFHASGSSYSSIGRIMDRDHSTIIYSVSNVDEALKRESSNIMRMLIDVCHLESEWF